MTDQQREFREFMHALMKRAGSWRALADQIGIENTSAIRAANESFTLSTENCLKLAEALGEDPSRVLRLAGKPDVAERIETLYGKAEVTSGEAQLLVAFRAIDDPEKRRTLYTVARQFAGLPITITPDPLPLTRPTKVAKEDGAQASAPPAAERRSGARRRGPLR